MSTPNLPGPIEFVGGIDDLYDPQFKTMIVMLRRALRWEGDPDEMMFGPTAWDIINEVPHVDQVIWSGDDIPWQSLQYVADENIRYRLELMEDVFAEPEDD